MRVHVGHRLQFHAQLVARLPGGRVDIDPGDGVKQFSLGDVEGVVQIRQLRVLTAQAAGLGEHRRGQDAGQHSSGQFD
ncbi:MAG: hypothetical protein QGF90_12375 [Gammaproteobacteria bacterium]|nr:hypothetical protein [Gammaproteobacteria bacterium]